MERCFSLYFSILPEQFFLCFQGEWKEASDMKQLASFAFNHCNQNRIITKRALTFAFLLHAAPLYEVQRKLPICSHSLKKSLVAWSYVVLQEIKPDCISNKMFYLTCYKTSYRLQRNVTFIFLLLIFGLMTNVISLSYRKQSIDLQSKSFDQFLYEKDIGS